MIIKMLDYFLVVGFILFMVSFAMQELMSLISSHGTNRRTDAEAETPILWPSDAKS